MTSPHAVVALVAALIGLAGCKDSEIEANMQSLGAPGLGLAAFSGDASPSLSSSIPEPEPVDAIPQPASSHELQYGDPGYVCTAIFRQKSCDDDGKPHDLDPNTMEWIN